jgi:hypothetical protein
VNRSKKDTFISFFVFDFVLCPGSLVSVAIQHRRGMQGYRGRWSLTLGWLTTRWKRPATKKKEVAERGRCRTWRASADLGAFESLTASRK